MIELPSLNSANPPNTFAQREGSLRALLKDSTDVILLVDRHGTVLFASDSVVHIEGSSSSDMLGTNAFERVHPDDADRVRAAFASCAGGKMGRAVAEYRQQHRDGTWRHREAIAVNRLADPGVNAIVVTYRDITERKRAQQEIDHFFNLSPDMIAAFDYDGRVVRSNPMGTQVLGYPAEALQGQHFLPLVHPEDRDASAATLAGLTQGETLTGFTNRVRAADGSYRTLEWNAKADPNAKLIYAVARDQTERRQLEHQFRQSQKMEAVGRLAGGVAHDFNNLLTAIIGFGEMTMEQLADKDVSRADVQQILNAAQSAASLTRQLLAFSRKQILEPEILDLNTLVGNTQSLLRRVIGEDVALVTDLQPQIGRISADRGQIEQIVMNLAVNARDAMPEGGTLRITTEMVDHDRDFVAAHPGSRLGPHVRLTLADTGMGMSDDVLAHLFEPFFTTKGQGKGTGLGLATVYGIVKQSGGYIWVESEPGSGASFKICFPCMSIEAPDAVAPKAIVRGAAGTETILFVEDQVEVRDAVRRSLQRRGYRVIEAADGPTGLELMRTHPGRIHLLLTDVVLPQMSGRELADIVTSRDLGARVLYMTGYTDDAIVHNGVLESGVDLIRKPFMPDQLLACVREILDRPSEPVVL